MGKRDSGQMFVQIRTDGETASIVVYQRYHAVNDKG